MITRAYYVYTQSGELRRLPGSTAWEPPASHTWSAGWWGGPDPPRSQTGGWGGSILHTSQEADR
eukprot:8183375-Pyramimonas_sp.AAC.1